MTAMGEQDGDNLGEAPSAVPNQAAPANVFNRPALAGGPHLLYVVVWQRAVTHLQGPLGFGPITSMRIAGVIVHYDRLRGVWHTKGRNVWVETASSQPLLPARRWVQIVRATLTTPG